MSDNPQVSNPNKLFYFTSYGCLITIHGVKYKHDMIPKILHEYVSERQFGAGVTEYGPNNKVHTHILLWCQARFTWVRQNVLSQLEVSSCHIQAVYTYEQAISTCAYLCKERVPQIWSIDAQTTESVKRHIRSECIAFRARQNTGPGEKFARKQLNRVEAKWFTSHMTEKQLADELWGSVPDSSAYSISQ